jgi:hypothetical protein
VVNGTLLNFIMEGINRKRERVLRLCADTAQMQGSGTSQDGVAAPS